MIVLPEGKGLSEADYARFRELAHQTSGLDFPEARQPELERAVLQTLAETSLPGPEALYRLLTDGNGDQPLLDALIERLTVNETHFFRNQPQFEVLEQRILPDLIIRRQDQRSLRLWCAGCASGEEPYSIAILLDRLLPEIDQWSVLILATDINRQRLAEARRGRYRPWSFRGAPPEIQVAYFSPQESEFQIVPHVGRLVTFQYLNLAEDTYPSLLTNTQAMDLILCRNVLMYFRLETARRVVGRLYECLTDGGYLVVGHAEPSQEIFHQFAMRSFPGTVLYQRLGEGFRNGPAPFRFPAAPVAIASEPRVIDAPRRHHDRTRKAATRAEPAGGPPATTSPPSTPYEEALALAAAGKDDEALRRLEALAASNRDDGRAPYLAAKICASRLQLKAAERWIEVALQRAPLMAPAHYLHGLTLQEDGRPDAALAALRRCTYADPEFVLAYLALAGLLRRLGHGLRAEKALDTAAALLGGRNRDDPVPEAEGLTVGWLLELIATQRES